LYEKIFPHPGGARTQKPENGAALNTLAFRSFLGNQIPTNSLHRMPAVRAREPKRLAVDRLTALAFSTRGNMNGKRFMIFAGKLTVVLVGGWRRHAQVTGLLCAAGLAAGLL
jgi:hypothetical protein